MNRTSTKFAHKLKDVAKGKKIIDIQEIVHKCTLDIICGKVFLFFESMLKHYFRNRFRSGDELVR